MKKENKHIYLYIGLTIAVIFIALTPYIFAKGYSGVVFNADTGAIGDTIGGITAPFVNLLAAFLVWISFREQVKANKLLSTETSYNFIKSLMKDLNITYNDFAKNKYPSILRSFNLNKTPYKSIAEGQRYLNNNRNYNDETDKLFNLIFEHSQKSRIDITGFLKTFSLVLDNIEKSSLDKNIKNTLLILLENEFNYIKSFTKKTNQIAVFTNSYNDHFKKNIDTLSLENSLLEYKETIKNYTNLKNKYTT